MTKPNDCVWIQLAGTSHLIGLPRKTTGLFRFASEDAAQYGLADLRPGGPRG